VVVVHEPLNPHFPVTIGEWRNELAQRSEVFGQPAGYWCYVRPGHYLIGGWEQADRVETITLPGFWVAKHPITVRQYRQFMEAGGYATRRYWTDNGWTWKERVKCTQPDYWDEERFRGDSQPVIGVSWYEAAAFAAWLSHHLASDLPPGSAIRLPTEAEWEAAAAYDAAGRRRTYPWGNEPEPTRDLANFDVVSDPDRPAPVGKRTAGAAACGAQEMVGSVWEAASSSYDAYPAGSGVLVEDFQADTGDVPCRGGCWVNPRTYVRCGSRRRYVPCYGYDNWGFRLFLPSNVRSGVLDSES